MRINRRVLSIVLCLVLIAVFSLTIAYAALNAVLNISGNANVTASDWSLKIEKLDVMSIMSEEDLAMCSSELTCVDNYIYFGDVTIEKFPVVAGTSIKDFAVSLTKPGDGVEFCYTITNNGSIPAKLESINYKTPQITSSTNNQNDIAWGTKNFQYDSIIEDISDGSSIEIGDVLCPGDSKMLFFVTGVWITDTVSSSKLSISNLGTDYVFVQADKNLCN